MRQMSERSDSNAVEAVNVNATTVFVSQFSAHSSVQETVIAVLPLSLLEQNVYLLKRLSMPATRARINTTPVRT